MTQPDVTIIGAGPAGLAAAIEAAKWSKKVALLDENALPGGQLFKQIHKFFGSREHGAGIRGIDIGRQMCDQARDLGVTILLDTVAFRLYEDLTVGVLTPEGRKELASRSVILACGAMENTLPFKGWTKPGVMGAGAVQTMMNVQRVLPGRKFLMVGSGNVGLIVTYQLLQAGADVEAIVEIMPKISGYHVHGGKVRRAGVPILTSHTVIEARGKKEVESALLGRVDEKFQVIPGSEREIAVDTVCLAVGLTPMAELAFMAGCRYTFISSLGGFVPLHDQSMETTVKGLYVAGDITGIEEANTAVDEGRLAGVSAVAALGLMPAQKADEEKDCIRARLASLRMGSFGEGRKEAKQRILRERTAV